MQNITIPTTQPVVSAQTQTTRDNSNEQPAEPFGRVLARQLEDQSRTNETEDSDADQPDTKNIGAALITGTGSDITGGTQLSVPDGSSALPGDRLTALLPGVAAQPPVNRAQSAADAAHPGPVTTAAKGKAAVTILPSGSATTPSVPAAAATAGMGIAPFASALGALDAHDTSKDTAASQAAIPQPGALTQTALQTLATQPVGQSSPVQTTLSTPLFHNAWADEFSQKITWLATQHSQSAELHLNPPQLGPLNVVIQVNGDQATAMFTSPHAAVRDSIEQALPKLREMLADSGIMLGNATVSDQSPREQRAGQSGQQQKTGEWSGGAPPAVSTNTSDGISRSGRRHSGVVDTFA